MTLALALAVALAHLPHLALALPLALDGEAETSNNLGLGIISAVSIAAGWIGLFCLWFFVFRDRSRAKQKKEDSSER
jgi:hypothetical protein